jgi:ArsR family transcriptional regulator
VELVQIYECLCDLTRLRLLNVLAQGPLCVCHFQEILGEPQVKISKHLAYLRERGLVECERRGSWMVYALPEKPATELKANLACLQVCAREDARFKRDLTRLAKLARTLAMPASDQGLGCGCERPEPARRRPITRAARR